MVLIIFFFQMRTKLSSFGVDPYDLSIISQSGCPKHPNGTEGVNISIDPNTFSAHNFGEAVRKTGGVIGKNCTLLFKFLPNYDHKSDFFNNDNILYRHPEEVHVQSCSWFRYFIPPNPIIDYVLIHNYS